MKLNYLLLRKILEHIECVGDGQTRHSISSNSFSESEFLGENFDTFAYHSNILIENGFVDGKVYCLNYYGNKVFESIDYFGLNLSGHQLLESMRNEDIWKKIKSTARSLGIEEIKKIPGLAVKLLMGGG